MHKRVSKNVLPIPKHVSDRESATRSSLARLVVGGGRSRRATNRTKHAIGSTQDLNRGKLR